VGIDAPLARRLELLRDSGQLDADISEFLATAFESVADDVGLELTDDTFGTALTHTALALQRARNGEAIEQWGSDHSDELAGFPQVVSRAESFATEAEQRLGLEVPAKEREFLALHLAALSVRSSQA
jgi:hypothetical protein